MEGFKTEGLEAEGFGRRAYYRYFVRLYPVRSKPYSSPSTPFGVRISLIFRRNLTGGVLEDPTPGVPLYIVT